MAEQITKVIYRPEEERRSDKRALLRKEKDDLINQQYRIKKRLLEIEDKLSEIPDHMCVASHAIERFIERIQEVPTKVARKILSDSTLIDRYTKGGYGTYKLTGYPNVLVVVSNYTVLTCFSAFDYKTRLEELEQYMDYYIRELIHQQRNGFVYKIKTIKQFRKTLYQ